MSNISKPFVEYRKEGQYGTSIRKPSPEEFAASAERAMNLQLLRDQLEKLRSDIKRLEKECPHTVSYDIAGFPYDTRLCHACGKHQGQV